MNKNKNIIILCILFIVIILLTVFLYFQLIDYFSIIEKREILAKVIIGEQYGFDINGTALIFGMVPPGTEATREIFLDNKYGLDVKVTIFVKGEIQKFMRISENDFILKENENRKIKFFINVPKNIEYGVYEGKVIVFIKKDI